MNEHATIISGTTAGRRADCVPLVVDLDGTLLRSDLLIETIFALLGRRPSAIFPLLRASLRGMGALKAFLAERIAIDPQLLPYDPAVVAEIEQAAAQGCPVHLISASNERYVQQIAEHLEHFAGHAGSTAELNMSGKHKAAMLVEKFGDRGFDYIGNAAGDLPIWERARARYAINMRAGTARRLRRLDPNAGFLTTERLSLGAFARMLRVHQWPKNALIGIPLLASHLFTELAFLQTMMAIAAFCLCASSVYILNDLFDLTADRLHRTKRFRPLASGLVSPHFALATACCLIVASAAIAAAVSPMLLLVLAGYLLLTSSYSLTLKRKMVLDLLVLALLYTIRVIAGAVAIGVVISPWLLGFSMFIFTSLALIKRYTELVAIADAELPDPTNRNYRAADSVIVAALAAAAGFNSVTVLALWLSSEEVQLAYRRPELLWLICPIVMYWIARALMMAHRRLMNDDPVVFALKDRNSRLAVLAIGLVVLAAI